MNEDSNSQSEPEAQDPSQAPDATASHDEPAGQKSVRERASREVNALETILRKTRRAWRGPMIAEAILWYFATVGAVLSSGLIFALLLPSWGALILRWASIVGISAATLLAALAAVMFFRRQPGLDDIAALVQRHAPQFRNDIVAALQFGRALRDGASAEHYSEDMAFAHVQRTTRTLRGEVDGQGTLVGHLPGRNLMPALMALTGSLVLLAIPYLITPEKTARLFAQAMFPVEEDAEKAPEYRPVVGDIDLYYAYPQYSDLPARFEAYTTGHIDTLIGTEVTLKTYPLVEASQFEIVVDTGEGSRTIAMQKGEGDRLEGTLLVTRPGKYHFRAIMPDGSTVEDGIERSIRLQPDQVPEIVITSHEGEVEVTPDDVLEIAFTVSDDFGIESVSRAYHFAGDEQNADRAPVELPELSHTPSAVEGSIQLDLTSLGLQPKDVVIFQIHATDNNSLTGPGIGQSQPLVLRVASPEDKHMKIIADQQQVVEALLDVLGDFLEAPVGERVPGSKNVYRQKVDEALAEQERSKRYERIFEIHRNQRRVLAQMADVVERMKEDPLMLKRDFTLFQALYEQLYALNRDGQQTLDRFASSASQGTLSARELQSVADYAARQEDALEKGILRLEDLLAAQKMEAIKATAEDIRKLKDRLKELLEKYRDTRDPELKQAIQREIQRLRQRMSELLARMQSQLQELPREHVNMEAIEQAQLESDTKKLGDNLQRIEDLLEQDDVDGALEALEQMAGNLDSLTQEMDSQFGQAQPEGLSELDQKLSELMDRVNDVEQLQREVEKQTNEVRQKLEQEHQRRIDQMLEREMRAVREMVERQKAQLEAMERRELPSHDAQALQRAKERVQDLQRMLEQKDVEQGLERAKDSVDDLRSMQFSMELSQRYTDDTSDEGRAVSESVEELGEMVPRGRRVVRELEKLMERARSQMAQQNDPRLEQLAQEQESVEQQARRLREELEKASEKFPMLEQQLEPSVDRAHQAMGEAHKGLRERRTQRALDHQRTALDELRNLRQTMRDTLEKRRMEQSRGRDHQKEKVAIPDKDSRKSHKEFRQEVQKGMKEDRLQDYGSEIERYYKSLME